MSRLVVLLMMIATAVLPAVAQPSSDVDLEAVLARVGDREISVRDFMERYEATPWIGRERSGMEERNRIEFLASMIAEALLAIDAERQGVEWQPAVRRTIDEIERLNVLDALYRQEVMEPVGLSDETIDRALSNLLMEVTFKYLIFDNAGHAREVFDAARHGVPFDSMAVAAGQEGQVESRRWSEFVPAIEQAVYDTLEVGRTVPPVEVDGQWYVVQIAAITPGMPPGVSDVASAREVARRTLQWRAEQQHLEAFLHRFSQGKDVTVHGEVFQRLADAFRKAVAERRDALVRAEEEPYPLALGGAEFGSIRGQVGPLMDQAVVSGPGFTMSVSYVMDRIAFKGFSLDSPDVGVSMRLSDLLQKLIHEEFLAREGYDRGLDDRPDVRREVERWQRAHLAYTVMKEIAMSRPDGAEHHVWDVDIQEVLLSDIATADSLLRAVMDGADLTEIARRHSLRPDAAATGGVSGYFRTDEREDVGMAASIIDIGALFGPVQTDEGHVIFRLLDRRPIRGSQAQTVESVSERINMRVARLAQEHAVEIDLDLLRTVPVTRVNKMVYRYMGFGNRMPAAPSLYKMTQWLDLMEQSDNPFAS